MRRVLGVLVLGVLFAGCGGGSEGEGSAPGATPAPPPSSTVESTSPTTQPRSDEEAILAAVQGYWQAFLVANDPPDTNHPALRAVMAGPALTTTVDRIEERQRLRQVVRLPSASRFRSTPQLESVDGGAATVLDCLVDDSMVIDEPSGLVLNSKVSTFLFRHKVARLGASWFVTEVEQVSRWDGVTQCE
jgi:hypothetical protein